ncbi:acyl dehydratase [Rhodococcus sp. WS4]|nr:acyl dehydratase [Rhodococcus sp. WS4]
MFTADRDEGQRYWEDVTVGEQLDSERFPLSLYRLVMAAGGNRDFNSIHHNPEYAAASGAPTAYANHMFLQGMWEKTVRRYIGLAGTIRALRKFTMRSFNTVDDIVTVSGTVADKWRDGNVGVVLLRMWSDNGRGVSVGPGEVEVTLPMRQGAVQ